MVRGRAIYSYNADNLVRIWLDKKEGKGTKPYSRRIYT